MIQSKWRFNWRKRSSWAFFRYDLIEEKLLNIFWENWLECKIGHFWPILTILTNLEWFNQNGVLGGEGDHDGPSICVIRKKVTGQFLRKLALNAKSVIFDLFLTILTNLERFNQNGVSGGEGDHDEPSICVIRKKVTEQFLRKLDLSVKCIAFLPIFNQLRPIFDQLRPIQLKWDFHWRKRS